jgi:diguanylate cyclase (GGDEF)-like protein
LPEKKRQARAFISARMVVVLAFIAFWGVLFPVGWAPTFGFALVLAFEEAMFITALGSLRWLRTPAAVDSLHFTLLILEAVCHSLLFYFLGGLTWLGAIAFLYALMYAIVYMKPWQAMTFTVMISAAFLAVSVLDATETIPHFTYLPQDADRYKDAAFVVPSVIGFMGVASTVTFWMIFIGGEMRRQRDVAIHAYTEMARAQEELRMLNEELEAKVQARTQVLAYRAERDTLTGLLNRGTVARRCHELLALARRSGSPVAVIIGDGDNFKACNDAGGHHYGDQVLHLISQALTECSRDTDLVGRFGGDEFLIVLPDTGASGAEEYCSRLLKTLESKRPDWIEDLPFPSLSLGIAVYPEHGSDADSLIKAADRAMYAAKSAGGRCWRLAEPAPLSPQADGARTSTESPGESSPPAETMVSKPRLP